MTAKELITEEIPPLLHSDKGDKALVWMDEFKVSHLPVLKNGNFVVEGRDIGTVVFPDAKYKFFLTADYDVRAQRRLEDFKRVNEELNVNKIKQDLIDRDQYDSSRKLSPLKQASDAIVIDTSNCTFDDQVNQIYKHIERN